MFSVPEKSSTAGLGELNFADVRDGTSNTIMIVETNQDNVVTWTKPEDIDPAKVEDIVRICKGQLRRDEINVGFADGSCQTLVDPSNGEVRKMLTRDGGEVVSNR